MNFRILYDRLKKRFAGEQVAQANDSDVLVLIETYQQLLDKFEAMTEASGTIIADRDRLSNKVTELEATLENLKKMLFGRRTEKRPLDSNYDLLMFGEPEAQREARKR
jgi:hypothetical protein